MPGRMLVPRPARAALGTAAADRAEAGRSSRFLGTCPALRGRDRTQPGLSRSPLTRPSLALRAPILPMGITGHCVDQTSAGKDQDCPASSQTVFTTIYFYSHRRSFSALLPSG